MNITPIITVRGGSSLKDKNIRLYKGTPLLAICVEKCVKVFGSVFVLSDTEKYREIAEKSGATVIIDDKVGGKEDVTVRLSKFVKKHNIDGRLILCQCTSPNISIERYKEIFEKSKDLEDDEILLSCVEVSQKPSAFYLMNENGNLYTAIKGMPIVSKPRQILEKVYYYNGGLTSFHSSQLIHESFFEKARLIPFMITEEEMLDIDNENDFKK